jgi:hypothetical protein
MRVQIDESGSNHKPSRIDLDFTAKGVRRNRRNLLAGDSQASDCIKTRRGIDNAALLQHDVVGLRR